MALNTHAYDPWFGRPSSATTGEPTSADARRYVIKRAEDGSFLGADDQPTMNIADASTHASKPIAALLADHATKTKRGMWEAIEHPGEDPDEDGDLDSRYPSSAKRAA